eukprot:CAMPEP_0194030472 /NCGR_PEP_ID=MMETSP0009_2-20130614/3942_1 /TAXON_ID=210454 /ORGANISM="Grammatophora oceanica, Strain CCMP 410" /LENGTH=520 /DNA_ID=CAMNT_0038670419 /DNA_START=19 /DNA_END=1581 /DNA_ORIENTATION=-
MSNDKMMMEPGLKLDELNLEKEEQAVAEAYAVPVGEEKEAAKAVAARSNKKKFLWIGIIAFLVIVAAAITTGVLVSKKNKDKDSSRGSNLVSGEDGDGGDGGNPEKQPIVTDGEPTRLNFTESKSTIDFICGEDKTLEQCKAACEEVNECCSWDGDCVGGSNDWEGCVDYAKCHVVKSLEEPAPADLPELCSQSDLDNCEDACREVECCYKDELECDSTLSFLTCLDYAPCQNLRTDSRVSTAVEGLQELCSPLASDSADRDACDTECDKAQCCWSTEMEGENSNCLESDFIACLTYAPCGLLSIPESNGVVAEAPADLFNDTCALDNIWETGADRDACEAVCEEATCCGNLNMTDDIENCFMDDPFGCAAYAPCALLQVTGGDVARAPENLMETCSWSSFDDPAVEKQCEDACDQARCCWESDENCLTDGNLLTCLEYAPCAILLLVGDEVPEPEEAALETACSRESYEEDPATCEAFCKDGPAGCCFNDESLADNCYISNFGTCTQWSLGGCFRLAFN